jgi:Prophage antirepressor
MNEIEIFKNEEFGEIRTILIDGKPYFCANDVAKALGYAKPNNAVSTHCRATLKQVSLLVEKFRM